MYSSLIQNLIVWEIATGVILRSFLADSQSVTHDGKMAWPILQWSHDDQYCARMIAGKQGLISVFGLPGMNLLDKKSIKVANLSEMMWQPNANVLAYSTPEDGNVPARVSLVSIPSREILRTRNIFNVLNSQMYWHPDGAYLLVQIERQKTKKSTVVSFEVLRMREKDIPVDIIEMAPKEEFKGVFWEPKGHRFCVLSRVEMKHFATFHQVETGRGTAPSSGIKALKKVEVSKGVSVVSWSPNGRFCVLCGVRGTSGGDLVFWDTEELAELASNVHFNLTDVQWDPSGRVFTSSVTCAQSSSDAGFTMWTMSGKELYKETATKFTNLTWRPRPPTLLTSERQAEITKDIKKYSKLFEQQDYKDSNAAMSEKQIKRQTQWREYRTYIRECEKRYAQEHAKRVAVYGLDPDAKKAIVEEKWVAIQETVLE